MRTVTADEPTVQGEQPPHRHRITLEDYHRMMEVGLLASRSRVELIEGEIVDLAPRGDAHRRVVMRLDALLREAVGTQATVLSPAPIRLGADSEPEPDLAVVRTPPDAHRNARPTGADALVLIEVSDTTWHYDHDIKVPFYARHGIPEVWLFDLSRATAHFFRGLAEGHYTDETATDRPGLTFLPGLTDLAVDLCGLLPTA
jgi:Uma2 family endonuclease